MNHFETELFLREIKNCPTVWKSEHKDYKDKKKRQDCWNEIYKKVNPKFVEYDEDAKTKYGKLLQKRWRNLRACFSRELREKTQKYKHYRELLFLLPQMRKAVYRKSAPVLEDDDEDADSDEEDEKSVDTDNEDENSVDNDEGGENRVNIDKGDENNVDNDKGGLKSLDKFELKQVEHTRRKIEKKKKIVRKQAFNNITKKRSEVENIDREKHFALSLVPLLKKVPDEVKIDVQIQILQIFKNVEEHYPQHRPSSYVYEQEPSEMQLTHSVPTSKYYTRHNKFQSRVKNFRNSSTTNKENPTIVSLTYPDEFISSGSCESFSCSD